MYSQYQIYSCSHVWLLYSKRKTLASLISIKMIKYVVLPFCILNDLWGISLKVMKHAMSLHKGVEMLLKYYWKRKMKEKQIYAKVCSVFSKSASVDGIRFSIAVLPHNIPYYSSCLLWKSLLSGAGLRVYGRRW